MLSEGKKCPKCDTRDSVREVEKVGTEECCDNCTFVTYAGGYCKAKPNGKYECMGKVDGKHLLFRKRPRRFLCASCRVRWEEGKEILVWKITCPKCGNSILPINFPPNQKEMEYRCPECDCKVVVT